MVVCAKGAALAVCIGFATALNSIAEKSDSEGDLNMSDRRFMADLRFGVIVNLMVPSSIDEAM